MIILQPQRIIWTFRLATCRTHLLMVSSALNPLCLSCAQPTFEEVRLAHRVCIWSLRRKEPRLRQVLPGIGQAPVGVRRALLIV